MVQPYLNGVKLGLFNLKTKDKKTAKELVKSTVIKAVELIKESDDGSIERFLYKAK